MPGNVANASPSGVFPQTLVMSFSESREYVTLQNTLHDGTPYVGQLAQTSRHIFKLNTRLKVSQLATLRAFWIAKNGGQVPFYFYNPYDGSPVGSNYDPTGASTTGRYTVRFNGDWSQSTDMQRSTVPNIELVEVA